MKTLLLAAVLALPLSLAAQQAAPEKAAAPEKSARAELRVGTGLENREITGAAAEFKVAPDTKIYAGGRVAGLATGGKVTLVFAKGDRKVFEKELGIGGASWRVNAYRTFRAGDSGEWTAKLLGPDGAELAATKFTVDVAK